MSQNKTILLIEDDPFAADWVARIINKRFSTGVAIKRVASEREFLMRQPELERERSCAAVILDLILPWEDGVSLDASDKYIEPRGDAYEAGMRILRDLKDSEELRDIPVVIYSVTDEDRIAWPDGLAKTTFINKQEPDFRLLEWLSMNLAKKA